MLDFGYYNMDCMEGMKEFPDKYFDLAVVDPPYGINIHANMGEGKKKYKRQVMYPEAEWDSKPPTGEYFDELFRVANKVVIWGGNYFSLPPTRCFLIYRKMYVTESMGYAMAEFAWTNLNGSAKEFDSYDNNHGRIHPTQKPVALYSWIFRRYAERGMKILDTHVGSASSLIAAHDAGLRYVGFELDEYYYQKSKERMEEHFAQVSMFKSPEEKQEQIEF